MLFTSALAEVLILRFSSLARPMSLVGDALLPLSEKKKNKSENRSQYLTDFSKNYSNKYSNIIRIFE